MGFFGFFSSKDKNASRTKKKYPYATEPSDLFTNSGKRDGSDVRKDTRSEEEKKASGYDYDAVFFHYISSEPKKIYVERSLSDEDFHISDINLLMGNIRNNFSGDDLSAVNRDSSVDRDSIVWRAYHARGSLGYSNGWLQVEFDRNSKQYRVDIYCTSAFLVYGHHYTAGGFENQSEVMSYLRSLKDTLALRSEVYEKIREQEKNEALKEAV